MHPTRMTVSHDITDLRQQYSVLALYLGCPILTEHLFLAMIERLERCLLGCRGIVRADVIEMLQVHSPVDEQLSLIEVLIGLWDGSKHYLERSLYNANKIVYHTYHNSWMTTSTL